MITLIEVVGIFSVSIEYTMYTLALDFERGNCKPEGFVTFLAWFAPSM